MRRKARQRRGSFGMASRRTTKRRFNPIAAKPTRPRTTVKGGKTSTSTLKKNAILALAVDMVR